MTALSSARSPLVEADTRRTAVADAVLAGLHLPKTGLPVYDPATGDLLAYVPDLDVAQSLDAVRASDAAGAAWARTTPRHRANILYKWWELLVENTEQLAHLITREMGKPLAEARGEVKYGADFVRWYAEEAVRTAGGFREAPDGGSHILVRRSPVGLAVLITPWNFPFAMATRKIAPALAAGCGAVIKPATLTPVTTYFAVELARRAGVPDDLVEVVTTSNSGAFSDAVLRDPRVRKVSFTGSTAVGKQLLKAASDNVLRTSMELGGNAPLIVFDDADLERAVEGTLAAKLRNSGQSCIAANRIYVQEGIADSFAEALAERMAEIPVGNGFGSAVVGPLIDGRAVDNMCAFTDDALAKGAQLLAGGTPYSSNGHFYAPTVLDHVPATANVANEEIFGPIAAIQRFATEAEVVARANDTEFGLAGYVFTESLDRSFNVSDRLETGLVGINQGVPSNAAAPFGGVKHSGVGREGSAEGLEEYQNIRFYNIARRGTH